MARSIKITCDRCSEVADLSVRLPKRKPGDGIRSAIELLMDERSHDVHARLFRDLPEGWQRIDAAELCPACLKGMKVYLGAAADGLMDPSKGPSPEHPAVGDTYRYPHRWDHYSTYEVIEVNDDGVLLESRRGSKHFSRGAFKREGFERVEKDAGLAANHLTRRMR